MGFSQNITCTPLDEAFASARARAIVPGGEANGLQTRAPSVARRIERFTNAPQMSSPQPQQQQAPQRRGNEQLWRAVEAHVQQMYLSTLTRFGALFVVLAVVYHAYFM